MARRKQAKPPSPADFAAQHKLSPEVAVEVDRRLRKLAVERDEARAKYEAVLRQNAELSARLDTFAALGDNRQRRAAWKPPKRVRTGQAAAIVLVSDIHAEEPVTREETNGRNEYTLAVAEASIHQTFARALMLLDDARAMANVRTLIVWLGGDMISGHIHPELVERNSLSPLAACRWVSERLESGLRMLAERAEVDDLLVATSYGNHGRDTPKLRIGGGADRSYEQDMYLDLRHRLAGTKRMRWQIGVGYLNYVDVLGSTHRFHHGEAVKYSGGVGGWAVPMNKAVASWDRERRADWSHCGHAHQFNANYAARWTMNGSVIGYNPFAAFIKADYQPPLQAFQVWDRERGMTRVLPIYCR